MKKLRKKVIIVSFKEFEEFEYKKFGGHILEKYFDVEIWNVSKYFFDKNVVTQNIYVGQREIKTLKEFGISLQEYKRQQTFLFLLFPVAPRKAFYFGAIASLMGFRYSMAYCQPYLARWNSRTMHEIFAEGKRDWLKVILSTLFPPKFNFVAAPASFKEFPSVWSIKKQNNVMIHTLDYDVYLEIKDENSRLINDRYILFIDESYVAHYDYQTMDTAPPFRNSEAYYAPVRKFFDFAEKVFGYRIVIAEHPRAHYVDRGIYGNREMIRGQTARLVRDAELVLCHISTAIDYIILFQKKFIVLYLNEIQQFYEWEKYYIPLFHYLEIKGLNLSKPFNEDMLKNCIFSGSDKKCSKYKQNFIKAQGTRNEPFFEIVAEDIMKMMGGENE